MTEHNSDQSKAETASPRAANKSAKEAEEKRAEKELQGRRGKQLEDSETAVETLELELVATRKLAKRCEALSDHSGGFYDEINKLAKGKSLVATSDLVVEQANDIIGDAKEIIKSDIYLNRAKLFIAAGDNPFYPDVLVTIRTVRQSLDRGKTELDSRVDDINTKLKRAKTLVGALQCFLGDHETGQLGIKEDVDQFVEGPLDGSCFFWDAKISQTCFDFDYLDSQTVEEFLSIDVQNEDSDSEEDDDETGSDDDGSETDGDDSESDDDSEEGE